MNSQQLREAIVSDDEMFGEDETFDSNREDKKENESDLTNNEIVGSRTVLPSSPIWIATCSWPNLSASSSNLFTNRIATNSPGVLEENNHANLTPLLNITYSPPFTPLHSRHNNEHHRQPTPVTGKRSIAEVIFFTYISVT